MQFGHVIEGPWKWVVSPRRSARIDSRYQYKEVLGEALMILVWEGILKALTIRWSRQWEKWVFHPRLEVKVIDLGI